MYNTADTMYMCCLYIKFRKNWFPGVSHKEKTRHQTVLDFKYWPVLGFFNNRNIVKFTNKDI